MAVFTGCSLGRLVIFSFGKLYIPFVLFWSPENFKRIDLFIININWVCCFNNIVSFWKWKSFWRYSFKKQFRWFVTVTLFSGTLISHIRYQLLWITFFVEILIALCEPCPLKCCALLVCFQIYTILKLLCTNHLFLSCYLPTNTIICELPLIATFWNMLPFLTDTFSIIMSINFFVVFSYHKMHLICHDMNTVMPKMHVLL